jgi:hypothetical protein
MILGIQARPPWLMLGIVIFPWVPIPSRPSTREITQSADRKVKEWTGFV